MDLEPGGGGTRRMDLDPDACYRALSARDLRFDGFSSSESLVGVLPRLLAKIRNLFDLDARPDLIADHLGRDALPGPSILSHPGLRNSRP